MPTNNIAEGEDAVENNVESDNQQSGLPRHKPQLLRASTKADSVEQDALSASAEKCVKTINNQRSSNRLTKRSRRDNSPVDVVLKKPVVSKPAETPSIGSKTRRPWELWSVEDKNAFFEALCEYGKDFESIQSYIAQRSKKKSITASMIKNKDQVRHFYYRTWHKISKFLEISECVRKQTQELYGLINYGELRKKIGGCLNEKNRQKLNELVFSGVTTVKHKGKKLRIKTPVCRALKKLNNVTDTNEPEAEKLPKNIFVEFRPHTNAAWLQVQSLAQNPRIRTKVCLQKRLKPVIEYLQKRWKPYRLKRKEQIFSSLPSPVPDDVLVDDCPPVLRVKPPRDAKIFSLSFTAVNVASSSDVCLEKHMKLSQTLRSEINKTKKVTNVRQKVLSDNIEASSEKVDVPETAFESTDNNRTEPSDTCVKSSNKNTDDGGYINVLTPPKSVPELEMTIEQNFVEMERSFSLLTSVLDSVHKRTASCPSDDTDVICEESDKSSAYQKFEKKTISVSDSKEKDNSATDECIIESSFLSNGFDDNMTLGEYLSLNSRKDILSPSSLQDKEKPPDKEKLPDKEKPPDKEKLPEKVKSPEKEKDCTENLSDWFEDKDIPSSADGIFSKTVRNGWTTEGAGFLTFGELYLLLGKPSTIILEYEFEQPNVPVNHSEDEIETATSAPKEVTNVLNKVYELAHSFFTESKNKQMPGKQHGRSSKSTKVKNCGLSEKTSKDFLSSLLSANSDANMSSKDSPVNKEAVLSSPTVTSTNENVAPSSEKHVFVMPVGTAPRNVKPPDQISLKEEIGKLLPSTRRGCRVRRKPMVVQRPLLPREGMRTISGPRPMTVVHFVPSVSPITAVVPSSCARSENKISIPAAKKVVKIISPGSSIDVHPIQVPVMKQVHTDPGQNVILQPSSVPASHVIVNSTSGKPIQIINNQNMCHMANTFMSHESTVNPAVSSNSILIPSESSSLLQSQPAISETSLSSIPSLDGLNLDLLTATEKSPAKSDDSFSALSALSIPDTSALPLNISPTAINSILDDFGLASSKTDSSLNASPCLNVDPSMSKRSSPSQSPVHHPFRINSPEIEWLNGESTELFLNNFLSSVESPSKMSSSASASAAVENSNLDPIARLAPVVDSQVRCLLDECSIDFITTFEGLADVINNSSSNESKQT